VCLLLTAATFNLFSVWKFADSEEMDPEAVADRHHINGAQDVGIYFGATKFT
jgi:hypothetical protein